MSWRATNRGKNLFVAFTAFALKIHFLMYGSYRINEEREGIQLLAFGDEVLKNELRRTHFSVFEHPLGTHTLTADVIRRFQNIIYAYYYEQQTSLARDEHTNSVYPFLLSRQERD